jgi:hypothetical protein
MPGLRERLAEWGPESKMKAREGWVGDMPPPSEVAAEVGKEALILTHHRDDHCSSPD